MLLIFGSATTAKRVEKTASKYGIISNVIHTPKSISKSGCSHAVRLNEKDFNNIRNILINSDIKVLSVYKEYSVNGQTVYKEMVI